MRAVGTENVLNFDEVLELAVEEIGGNALEPTLLVGNGYSMALRPDIFSYSQLKQRLVPERFNLRDRILEIFTNLRTDDFEQVIRILQNTHYVAELYPLDGHEQVAIDIETLKDQLIEAITSGHPERPDDGITAEQYASNKRFLSKFGNIFTTNYDLLLYWSLNRNQLTSKFTDGFKSIERNLYWEGEDQNVFWLHGGLHLYHSENERFLNYVEVIKLRTEVAHPLIDQIREKLAVNSFPLTVAEGDWKLKAKRISESPFLRSSFKSLSRNSRNIVTFGIGFDQDAHIVKAILNSSSQRIFVGIHQPTITKIAEQKAKLASLIEKGKSVHFYDSGTTAIW